MHSIIGEINKEQMSRELPEFSPGDTVVVSVKVKEGSRERLQERNDSIHLIFTKAQGSYLSGDSGADLLVSPTIVEAHDVPERRL